MPVKLQFAVSRASLIFQKRFPDAAVCSQHLRLCTASTSCTRLNIAKANRKKLMSKIGKKNDHQKPSYVVPHVCVFLSTVKVLNFQTDMLGQTVQTQIRLLLKEQSDLGLHCLLFHLHHLEVLHHCKTFYFEF